MRSAIRCRWLPRIALLSLMIALAGGCPLQAQLAAPSEQLKELLDVTSRHYKSGAHQQALEAAERALALTLSEFGPDHERTAIQTYTLGMLAAELGRLQDAERYYAQSVFIREKVYGSNSAGTAQAMEQQADVILRQGRTTEAEPLLQRVLKIRSDLVGADHAFTASARAALGAVNIARRDYVAALEYYRDAVKLFTSQQSTQTLAKSVSEDEIRRNRGAFAGLAHAAWEIGGRPQGNRRAMMAESYAASQQAWSTSAASAVARMSARLGAANTELGGRIRRMQDMSERILALHADDMKALAAWNEIQRADPTYSALLDEFRQTTTTHHRDTAPFVARQKVLVAQLQAHLKRCPPGQKTAGCERGDQEREAITKELGELSKETSKGSTQIMAISQRMQAAERRLPGYEDFTARRKAAIDESQRLETSVAAERAAIVGQFPDYMALTEPKPLAIEETQALLQPGEALVTLLVGQARSFVWALSRERADWAVIEAGSEALNTHVSQLRRGLDPERPDTTALVPGSFDLDRAHVLYRLVLGPVASVLEGKNHLIVVPTGPLSSLPFQVLLTAPPGTDGDAAARLRAAPWLIRQHALSVLPSVQSLAALRRLAPQSAPPKPFLGIGDPALSGPEAGSPQARGRERAPPKLASLYRNGQADVRAVRALVPLPETADELRTVAKLLGAGASDLLLRADASETQIKRRRLEDYRVIQFATHGLVAGDLSGFDEPALVLTPPESATEVDDGLLTASEVASLTLAADWVVLSACNTASGAETGAEALSGLARAFFYAGARGLLVSHWAVNSEAAVGLTTQTFAALSANPALGRAEAFRRTMLGMIDAGRPPTYWAPFVILGEGANRR